MAFFRTGSGEGAGQSLELGLWSVLYPCQCLQFSDFAVGPLDLSVIRFASCMASLHSVYGTYNVQYIFLHEQCIMLIYQHLYLFTGENLVQENRKWGKK